MREHQGTALRILADQRPASTCPMLLLLRIDSFFGPTATSGINSVQHLVSMTDTPSSHPLKVGGVVLCGGRSSRMGQPKAMLPLGHEVMLQKVCRTLLEVVQPVCVVAAPEQELPDFSAVDQRNQPFSHQHPSSIRVARDPVGYRGPLAGLAVGLHELVDQVDAVYVSACDVPLLQTAFIQAVVEGLDDHEIVVPWDGQFYHPLSAVYRVSVLARVEELLSKDQRRPASLFEVCRTRRIDVQQLRRVDPELDSLRNANTPEEYALVLERLHKEDT